MNQTNGKNLWDIGLETIKELETDEGILASDRSEIYGCTFGRDSAVTGLMLLTSYERTGDPYFMTVVRKIVSNLSHLQGTATNIENGEEPGKIIHEFRESNHEHLTARAHRAWFIQPDKTMRNYDSVDSTLLYLLLVARYYDLSRDHEFTASLMPHIEAALSWMISTMDTHADGFITYAVPSERVSGGLPVQSWMDSEASIFHEDGSPTPYPIAPLEAQAYAYAAFRMWSREFDRLDASRATLLRTRAENLKAKFNTRFVQNGDKGEFQVAFALDGTGRPMFSARSSMGHILWASDVDCILDTALIPRLVSRLMAPDLFVPQAGVRTLSSLSSRYNAQSYHNGSIWPHDTAIVAEGLASFGYDREAAELRASLREAWTYFGTPVELYAFTDDGLREYLTDTGHRACRKQAWSAASMLAEL